MISALITLTLAAFLSTSYFEISRTLVKAGGDRAQVAADQIATLMAQAAQQRQIELRRIAADRAVQGYFEHPGDDNRATATRALATGQYATASSASSSACTAPKSTRARASGNA